MKVRFRHQIVALAMISVALMSSGCQVVEDGTTGVSKSFGEISANPLPAGIYVNVPVIREVEVWNVKTQAYKREIEAPSKEGLIVQIEATVLFRPTDVVDLRKKVGIDYVRQVLVSTVNDTFRENIGRRRIETIINEQNSITEETREALRENLSKRGILVEDLMVTGLKLPVKFREAIERKLEQEQKARQKEFELDQAKKDAEIEIARAEGAAKSQEIVRSTLSKAYLQYLWIKTLNDNPNVIYVATEANMPVFRTAPEPTVKSPANNKSTADSKSGGASSSSTGSTVTLGK